MITASMPSPLVRAARRIASAAALGLTIALAPACATISRPNAIWTSEAHSELNCTPLALLLFADGEIGAGSGVLVHPRVLLTAGHVVPDDPRYVVSQDAASARGEAVGVDRVVRGGTAAAASGDWAVLVLESRFASLAPKLALLPESAPGLAPGTPIWIAGLPMKSEDDPLLRRPLTIRTVCIERPVGAPDDPEVVVARNSKGQAGYSGASGGPAMLMAGPSGAAEQQTLGGIYLGTLTRKAAGIVLDREVLVHRLPLEEIRRVIAEVEAEDRAAAGRGS